MTQYYVVSQNQQGRKVSSTVKNPDPKYLLTYEDIQNIQRGLSKELGGIWTVIFYQIVGA